MVFLGLGLIAGEFKPVARFMGWLEEAEKTGPVDPKCLVGSAHRGAILIILTILLGFVTLGRGTYSLIFGG